LDRAFDPSSRPLAGETLDVEPAAAPPDEPEDTVASATLGARPAARAPAADVATRTANRAAASTANGSPAAKVLDRDPAKTGDGPSGHTALFGAVGVRSASDLATTFTRAFPQAASADPIWPTVPFGSAGSADLTLVLDEEGHLAQSAIGGSPSAALRRGIERTLTLLGVDRPFTARTAVTRMRVTAHLTRDDLHDGFHGDVFALSGGSFSRDVGSAFFALPPAGGPGRRIDVEIRLLP
jgi:hypothetical protein